MFSFGNFLQALTSRIVLHFDSRLGEYQPKQTKGKSFLLTRIKHVDKGTQVGLKPRGHDALASHWWHFVRPLVNRH